MISKQKSQLLGKQLEAMLSESAGEGMVGLEPGVSLELGWGLVLLPNRALGG